MLTAILIWLQNKQKKSILVENVEKEEKSKWWANKKAQCRAEEECERDRAAHCALSVLPGMAAPGMETEDEDEDELLECGLEKKT